MLKQLAVNVRYAEILALPLKVSFGRMLTASHSDGPLHAIVKTLAEIFFITRDTSMSAFGLVTFRLYVIGVWLN